MVVYNLTGEKHRVELAVIPVTDATNTFTDEFSLGPATEDASTDSKAYPDVKQMDDECRIEVTVDDGQTTTYDWEGDVNDYTGLLIHIDYGEVSFTRKVV